VHLVAGWSDVGDPIRQLRLRHRQRVEHFAQLVDWVSEVMQQEPLLQSP
jgi:hypothetical protein